MVTLVFVLALLGVAAPARAQQRWAAEDRLFVVVLPVYGVLAWKDASDTIDCVKARVCHEANPLIRPFVDRHGITSAMTGKLAIQAGIAGGLGYAMHRWPSKKRYILASFVTMTALQGYVVYRNHQTLKGK